GIGDVIKAVREEIARILPRDPVPIRRATGKPTVILIVGVNGTGKTTSAANLAHHLLGRRGTPEPSVRDWCQSPLPPQSQALLPVDATTGSNALSQARELHNALGLAGLIVTKLDGSGKGGIIVAIQDELGISTRFVGTGEKLDDFAPFDRKKYLENLL